MLGGKWVELLKEIAPRVAKVILLFNPPTATFIVGYLNLFKAAAAALDMEALVAPVHDMPEVELLFTTQARVKCPEDRHWCGRQLHARIG